MCFASRFFKPIIRCWTFIFQTNPVWHNSNMNFYKIIAHNLGFGIADFGFVEALRSINFYLPRHAPSALRSMLVAIFSNFPPGRRRRPLWAGGRIRTSEFPLPSAPCALPSAPFHYPLRASAYSAISSIVSLVGEDSNTIKAFLAVSI